MAKKEQREKLKAAKGEAAPARTSPKKGGTGYVGFFRQRYISILGVTLALAMALLYSRPQQLRVVPVERTTLPEMTVEHFLQNFSALKPLVVTGAWQENGWRPEQVAGACPDAMIRTFEYNDAAAEWGRLVQVGVEPLQKYFATHFAHSVSDRPKRLLYGFEMALKFHCPRQLESMSIPSFLTEDAFHLVTNHTGLGWPSVLLGPAGSETGLHIDTHRLPFWIAVAGEPNKVLKRFRLFPHDDRGLLKYGRPSETANFLFDFDPWQPNFRKYPAVADSFAYEAELRSGDLLYIPGGSPHAVKNMADNVGISMNYLDLKSMPDFVRKASPSSPLYHVLKGAGAWVIEALQDRRKHGKAMSYFEFAGVRDRDHFCEVHRNTTDNGHRPAGLAAYCGP